MDDHDFQNHVSESLGRIETKVDSFRAELLGPGGRVVALEEHQKWQDRKQWLHSGILLPVLGFLHKLFYNY